METYVLVVEDRGIFRAFLDAKTKTPMFTQTLHDAKRFKNERIAHQYAEFNELYTATVKKVGFVD